MYDVSSEDVSDTVITTILEKDNAADIAEDLAELLKSKKHKLVMSKLKTYYKNSNYPMEVAKAILIIFDKLSTSKASVFGDTAMDTSVDLIRDIINETDNRLENYKLIVQECTNLDQLFFIIREVVLGSEVTKREPILSQAELQEFQQTAADKIRSESQERLLHQIGDHVSHILYNYWADFGYRDETNEYLLSKLDTKDKVLEFLSLYLGKWSGSRGQHRGDLNQATYDYISKVVDLEPLYQIVINEEPSLADVNEYPELEDAPNDIGRVGNENSKEFQDILAKQFAYIHKRSTSEPQTEVVE